MAEHQIFSAMDLCKAHLNLTKARSKARKCQVRSARKVLPLTYTDKRYISRYLGVSAHWPGVAHGSPDAKPCAVLEKKASALIKSQGVVEVTFFMKVGGERGATTWTCWCSEDRAALCESYYRQFWEGLYGLRSA